jgi:hypothetical protein
LAARRFTRPDSIPLWHRMLVEEPGKLVISPVWLTVRLRNGEEYTGALSSCIWIGDRENTIEIALEKVVYTKPGARKIELPERRLLLKSSDILWLARVHESPKPTQREENSGEAKGCQEDTR